MICSVLCGFVLLILFTDDCRIVSSPRSHIMVMIMVAIIKIIAITLVTIQIKKLNQIKKSKILNIQGMSLMGNIKQAL